MSEYDSHGTRHDGLDGTSITTTAETGTTALAKQAEAMVQARFIVAMQRPRDLDQCRVSLLKECKRYSFAESALYHKPVGKGVEGLSIRFAESAIRNMRNISVETTTILDDASRRLIRVSVIDIEGNGSYATDIMIDKTVERSQVKPGQQVIGKRTNSQGKMTYLVAATEDDLLNKQNALISKAIRTNGLRHVPGDIIDECKAAIKSTLEKGDAADPDAARKRLCDAFAGHGIMPADIKEFLGHDIGQMSQVELARLRGILTGIRDGDTTWAECVGKAAGKPSAGSADEVLAGIVTPEAKAPEAKQAATVEAHGEPAPESSPVAATAPTPEPKKAAAKKPAPSPEPEIDVLASRELRDSLWERIENAATVADLQALTGEIGRAKLVQSDLEALRGAYSAKLKELKNPAVREREPGED